MNRSKWRSKRPGVKETAGCVESRSLTVRAAMIAGALITTGGDNDDPFWDDGARQMVKAVILHVLTAPEFEGERNLVTVRRLLVRGDWKAAKALRRMGKSDAEIQPAQQSLWAAISENPACGGIIADIGSGFSGMSKTAPKTFKGILQSAHRNTEFIDNSDM